MRQWRELIDSSALLQHSWRKTSYSCSYVHEMHSIIIAIIYWARKMDTICAGHLWTDWWPEHSRAAVLIFLDKAAQCSHARVTLFTSLQWSATLIALCSVSTAQLRFTTSQNPHETLQIFRDIFAVNSFGSSRNKKYYINIFNQPSSLTLHLTCLLHVNYGLVGNSVE